MAVPIAAAAKKVAAALATDKRGRKVIGYVMGYESPDGSCFISKTSAVLPLRRSPNP